MKPGTPGHDQLIELFGNALQVEPSERARFLDEACGSNEELRRELESLLASFAEADGFLESPKLTLDLVGRGRFTLLTGVSGAPWIEAAARASAELGVEVRAWQIGPGCEVADTYGDW